MSAKVTWQGVFPAVTTQFHADLSLDLDTTAGHLDVLIESGVSGLVMLGSLGENTALTLEEKREVMRTAIAVAAGRIPVLSGVAELNTLAGLTWVKELEALGAQGAMVMPSMAFRPDRDETIAHYRTIAEGTSLPLIVYNNPPQLPRGRRPRHVPGAGRGREPRRDQGVLRRRPADHRHHQCLRRPIHLVRRRRRPHPRVRDAWSNGLDRGHRPRLPGGEPVALGTDDGRPLGRSKDALPLVHPPPPPRHRHEVRAEHQARDPDRRPGREWVRLPRLPLTGSLREQVLYTIHERLDTRPELG